MIQNSAYICTFACNTHMVYLFIIIFLILGHLEASGTKSISPWISITYSDSVSPQNSLVTSFVTFFFQSNRGELSIISLFCITAIDDVDDVIKISLNLNGSHSNRLQPLACTCLTSGNIWRWQRRMLGRELLFLLFNGASLPDGVSSPPTVS